MGNIVENIRSQISGASGKLTGKKKQRKAGGAFPRDFNWSEFQVDDEIDVASGKFQKIGEFVVPSGQRYQWGYGEPNSRNQGYIYLEVKDDSDNEINGIVRLVGENPNDITFEGGIAMERRTETLTRKESDTGMPKTALPLSGVRVEQDDKLSIYFKPDSSDTVSSDDTTLEAPVTAWLEGA